MNRRIRILAILILALFLNYQLITVLTSSSASYNFKQQVDEPYVWIWEELANSPSSISGDDVVFWGESLGPYHNYTELNDKLILLNSNFPELVDVFSIGKTWHGRDILCVRLTNESVTSAKTEYYIVGQHHAREMISVENSLYFIDRIIYDSVFGSYLELLSSTELYIIPSLNPDGLSIMHWFPEQRKNVRPIDDDEDGTIDSDSDGFLDDEMERIYSWDHFANTSEIIEQDLDGDTLIAEDLPGGVDLNRNYGAYWNGTGSSPDKDSPLYRGETPFSENETQSLRDFMKQHSFNFAVSLHSGIKAIIAPWGHNVTLPIKDEQEFNALLAQIQSVVPFPLWNESGGYATNGVWDDYCYSYHDIMSFTFETYEAPWTGSYFDYYNPSGAGILSNCELVFPGLVYLASNPHLTFSNNMPSVEVKNPSTENQVFEGYTIEWTMSDQDGDALNSSVFASSDGYHWDSLATNLIDETSFYWNVTEVTPGSYYLKVAVSDSKDRIADTSEIRLNVKQEPPRSPFAFWILAVIIGTLGAVFLFFNLRKSKAASKVWGPDPYEEARKD
ncbi:MAG: M14 family zinc carboxypeptidase [Candidatus Heimdallarchaeota archaeon]